MERAEIDVAALTDVTVTLTSEEAEQVRGQARRTADILRDSPLDSGRAMAAIGLASCTLPARLIEALIAFRCVGNAYGTLVIAGMPVDASLPPTPADGNLPDWQAVPEATIAQLAVSNHLGDVIGYADEEDGRLVQDVIPVAGSEDRQENSGSAYLELHTEDGFHPFKPEYLALMCMRCDHEGTAYTITSALGRILPRLSRVCVQTLRQPLFRIRYSSSFVRMGSDGYSEPVAVLSGSAADPELVADFHGMVPLTLAARWALEELETVLTGALTGTVLNAGSLLLVDNRAAVHGRTAFSARYDGADRWLRRCLITADLRRSRGFRAPGSRVCPPLSVLSQALTGPGRSVPAAGDMPLNRADLSPSTDRSR